jgi:Ca2+-binding RTX toxin-like protein
MSMSDVKSKRLAAAASLAVGPARIRAVHVLVNGDGVGRLTITDGDGGATLVDLDFLTSTAHTVTLPDNGVRASDVYVSVMTNLTAATIFYS